MDSLVDKLFMHDPAWLDPDESSWEKKRHRTCGTRASLALRSMVEHGRGHVSTPSFHPGHPFVSSTTSSRLIAVTAVLG